MIRLQETEATVKIIDCIPLLRRIPNLNKLTDEVLAYILGLYYDNNLLLILHDKGRPVGICGYRCFNKPYDIDIINLKDIEEDAEYLDIVFAVAEKHEYMLAGLNEILSFFSNVKKVFFLRNGNRARKIIINKDKIFKLLEKF